MKTKLAAPHPHVEKRTEEHRALAPHATAPKSAEKTIKNAAAYNPHAVDKLETKTTKAPAAAPVHQEKSQIFGPNFDAEMAARDKRDKIFYRRYHAETAGVFVKLGVGTSAVLGGSAALVAGAIAGPVAAASAGIALGLTGLPLVAFGVLHWAITR